ncbi:hypothetical protein Rsub_05609 [Raphidocelis subcapitata]|uniref:Uncharacterized protein n=1 Tax=Raphidocelis subcapitata TaxID=307507 RepID=A0A2V0P5E8_9CHLO|nr:hypothetical protein Rsub_05609 [Raphidocelis subcapitata]|eukprot:GBF92407.1 hypothetical protein Rsub_05609 [Raphidocelis subcapitata]
MDDIKKAAAEAGAAVDTAMDKASGAVRSSLAWLAGAAKTGMESGQEVLESGKAKAAAAAELVNEQQDKAFGVLKEGVDYVVARPEIGYPLAAAATIAAFPGARRLLFRLTVGRFRSPEAVVEGAEQRLGTLGARIDDYGKEAQKLQARALSAHEEMTRGYSKLKAARSELQRLQSAVGKTERAAAAVLEDLRTVSKATPKATELRAEAAQKLAAVKQQHALLRKEVKWIAKLDV